MRSIAQEYDWPDLVTAERDVVKLARPDDYAGLYEARTGVQFRIIATEDGLLLKHGAQSPLPIYPSSEVDFFIPALNTAIRFEMDREKRITGLVISQRGLELKAGKRADAEM